MQAWLEWAMGPVFIFSFIFMILGLARHVVITLWEMRRIVRRAGDKTIPYKQIWKSTARWLFPYDKVVHQPVFSLTSVVFHFAILVVPIFLAGHIALWSRAIGVSWPAIPNGFADVLTIVAVVTALALVIQRVSARYSRSLSRPQDYLLPLIIAVPFATGFLVMHPAMNPFGFEATLFVHVMSANLCFVLMPLTKLSHAVLLPGVQLVSELGWHWPSDSGSQVEKALGKEGETI